MVITPSLSMVDMLKCLYREYQSSLDTDMHTLCSNAISLHIRLGATSPATQDAFYRALARYGAEFKNHGFWSSRDTVYGVVRRGGHVAEVYDCPFDHMFVSRQAWELVWQIQRTHSILEDGGNEYSFKTTQGTCEYFLTSFVAFFLRESHLTH